MTPEGLALLEEFEDCRLLAYLDTGGVWTIGIGTTRYPPWHPLRPNGRVKQGDVCTRAQAMDYLRYDLHRFETAVDALTTDYVSPRQNDALVCLVYNIGEMGYKGSTVRRLVNMEPNDPAIRAAFMMWHKDNGHPVKGLWNRRHREADHYFGVVTSCPVFPYPRAA